MFGFAVKKKKESKFIIHGVLRFIGRSSSRRRQCNPYLGPRKASAEVDAVAVEARIEPVPVLVLESAESVVGGGENADSADAAAHGHQEMAFAAGSGNAAAAERIPADAVRDLHCMFGVGSAN